MLFTLTCQAPSATDLGYLLHKNPASVYEKETWFGRVRVFYPEAGENRCTAAMLLDVDPVALVRGRGAALSQYVNDRPYVASSLMSVAIGEAFSTAMGGRSKERAERVDEEMALSASLSAVACNGGPDLIRRLFEPLGYQVEVERAQLDARFAEWGASDLYHVRLGGTTTVKSLLSHLYVLIPVLDNTKHYYVNEAEIDKLLLRGEGWLGAHPEKELITRRYLVYRKRLVSEALERVQAAAHDETETEPAEAEEQEEVVPRLNDQRIDAICAAVLDLPGEPSRVIDLGCGEGKLLSRLLREPRITALAGMDASTISLERAERRLHLDRLPEMQQARIRLFQGALTYRDERLAGYDVAVLSEVIEHLDTERVSALEQVVFAHARPRRVVLTTPNQDYNVLWPSLPAGRMRHPDHRFEWTRAEFAAWAARVASDHGYAVQLSGIGSADERQGAPTQMAVFDLLAS